MKAITPPRLLAACAAALLVLPSCRKATEARADPQWWQLESERIELAHRVELLELRLSKREAGDAGHADLKQRLEHSSSQRAGLSAKADGLKLELAQLRASAEEARDGWMRSARAAAVGRELATLSGLRGRSYQEVVVTRVTDVGVEFRHSTGTARLAAADLSPAQQEMFGLDAGLALEAIEQERRIASAYESWVDERVADADARQEAREQAAILASAASSRPQPVSAALPRETSSPSRLRQEARSVGRGNTTWYPYYGRHRYSYYSPYRTYSSRCYGVPSPYRVATPNIRVASGSWSYTPRTSGCSSPATTPRRSFPTLVPR
jgi:hypothetical protein